MKTIKRLKQGSELLTNNYAIKKTNMKQFVMVVLTIVSFNVSNAQIEKLSGPRVGMTIITSGSSADIVNEGFGYGENEKFGKTGAAFTTQFGWQWESRFGNGEGGFVGLVEWIALVGGLEKGMFLPSFSAIVGARTDKGWEFGMGPNLSLSGVGLVFGVGKNFQFSNLNVPINLAFIPGVKKKGNVLRTDSNNVTTDEEYNYTTGSRISLIVGFNMIKKRKRNSKIN